jgi:PhzF family phenazine biosynthesis protein
VVATYSFSQVDVFGSRALSGNPVAVVHGATGLDDDTMAAFGRWTNLSETTFLLPPEDPRADYRLRIFTPGEELPFAGHPTLGSAHAWLEAGGSPASSERIVQECGVGLVELRRAGADVAFRAPDFLRTGPVGEETLGRVVGALGVEADQLVGAWWIDNGPGWLGLELDSAASVLSLRPAFAALEVDTGVIGPMDAEQQEATGADVEVRAFCPGLGINEDPVTGSLNAGFAMWLTREGRLPSSYVVRQGTALDRDGRVQISTDDAGDIWVGGSSRTVVRGTLDL